MASSERDQGGQKSNGGRHPSQADVAANPFLRLTAMTSVLECHGIMSRQSRAWQCAAPR